MQLLFNERVTFEGFTYQAGESYEVPEGLGTRLVNTFRAGEIHGGEAKGVAGAGEAEGKAVPGAVQGGAEAGGGAGKASRPTGVGHDPDSAGGARGIDPAAKKGKRGGAA